MSVQSFPLFRLQSLRRQEPNLSCSLLHTYLWSACLSSLAHSNGVLLRGGACKIESKGREMTFALTEVWEMSLVSYSW